MTQRMLEIRSDDMLAALGLYLMLVVARLVCLPTEGLSGFLARRAIDGIAAIGWLADHLPSSQRLEA